MAVNLFAIPRTKTRVEATDAYQDRADRPLIEMRGIVKTFRNGTGDFTALREIDADFHRGEFVAVVGKSGSGKSTLVNMITGIDHPTSGTIRVGDTYIHKMRESEMARWRGRNLGIVFQFYQLLPMLTLLENVLLPMDFCDLYEPSERQERALALLDMVGLSGLEHKRPSAISGGQQQSAAIARALANDPPLLIADEPTGNLDSRSAEGILDIFERLVARGKTLIIVTHDRSLAQRASRILHIVDGRIAPGGGSGEMDGIGGRQGDRLPRTSMADGRDWEA
jgi:putative ABC transport system ATP-binding protein